MIRPAGVARCEYPQTVLQGRLTHPAVVDQRKVDLEPQRRSDVAVRRASGGSCPAAGRPGYRQSAGARAARPGEAPWTPRCPGFLCKKRAAAVPFQADRFRRARHRFGHRTHGGLRTPPRASRVSRLRCYRGMPSALASEIRECIEHIAGSVVQRDVIKSVRDRRSRYGQSWLRL